MEDEARAIVYAWGSSGSEVVIEDNGEWVQLEAVIDDAPDDALVSAIKLDYDLSVYSAGVVELKLVSAGDQKSSALPQGILASNTAVELDLESQFTGSPVNGTWSLMARSTPGGAQGLLKDFGLQISYLYQFPTIREDSDGVKGLPAFKKLPENLVVETANTPNSGIPGSPGLPSPGSQLSPSMTGSLEGVGNNKPTSVLAPESWQLIASEGFEGSFPNSLWSVIDTSSDGFNRYWDEDDWKFYSGAQAAWPANGGSHGLDPQFNQYPNNMDAWMVYGPFNLSDASAAKTLFYLWRSIRTTNDHLFFGVSADGSHFSGFSWTGSSTVWEHYSISYDDFVGDSSVWVAWNFYSDASSTLPGPWVDDIEIWKNTPGLYDCTTGSPLISSLDIRPGLQFTQELDASVDFPEPAGPYEIQLKSRQYIPPAGITNAQLLELESLSRDPSVLPGQRVHALVQFYHMPTQLEVQSLMQRGIDLLAYIPDRAWLASIDANTLSALESISGMRWIGPILASDKISPALLDVLETDQLEKRALLTVYFFSDTPTQVIGQILSDFEARLLDSVPERNRYDLLLPADAIQSLASQGAVQWLDFAPPEKIALNDCVRVRTNVNTVQGSPYNLSGSNVDLGIWDSGLVDSSHPDFSGRLTLVDIGSSTNDHATHVAGTMAGSGANSTAYGGVANQWKGMAPGADVFSYYFDHNITEHNAAINTHGIELSQNSWSYVVSSSNCSLFGNYSTDAPDYDDIVTGLYGDRINVVFAAGNDRDDGDCGMNSAPPYLNYSVIPPPATAKNVISVGATNSNDDSMTTFSSWGPVDDGRLKPDVVAPGCESLALDDYIKSTLPGGGYGASGWCGTSMAAPVVSGISALIIQQYRNNYVNDPLPSTVKGLLVHTALDLSDGTSYYNPGPDYASGYGRVDASAAADTIIAGKLREDTVSHGLTDVFTISIPPAASSARVTLVWDDEPGAPNANPALVNNLDLWLVEPDGTTIHRPWILNPASPSSDATRGIDNRNNLEQVYITSPVSGTWLVNVAGTSVLPAGQLYSLVGYQFTPLSPPAAFNKTSPSNGASGVSVNPVLSWSSTSSASSYEYCLDTSNNGACDASWIGVGTNTSVALSSLPADTVHYWQVRAVNPVGTTYADANSIWSFTTLPNFTAFLPLLVK